METYRLDSLLSVSSDQHAIDATATPDLDRYRLPRTAIPSSYALRIVPDLQKERFSGTVSIAVAIKEPVSELVLNSDELTISSAKINGSNVQFRTDSDLERLTLDCELQPGEATVTLAFEGAFNEQLVGFYLSRFTDESGSEHVLATTQFESTYARKAFPCWDEPDFKATFDITLIAPAGLNAIANSAETSRMPTSAEDAVTGEVITFATTMSMSTYLVAYVIGPIEITEPVNVDGTELRIVHVPGAGSKSSTLRLLLTGDEAGTVDQPEPAEATTTTVDLTAFAAECGAFGLRYFSEYFNVPYPGDKVDLVAVPDFAMGAMENLGCITFRESLLLVDPGASTQPELQRVADVIFHELAHMWFGDLVTMKWWNGLWLNEAFATFMEMRCTDAFRPQWQRWTDFGLSRSAAFDVDALASTRPIEFDVVSPEDAEGMFDVLTYEKGAAVVRMLEQHLGEEPFQAGIRRYMSENAYGNTETTDLWDAIETETGEPVRAIMDSWIFQGGTPVIYSELAANGLSATFTQERLGYAGGDESAEQTWMVPLRYRWKPVGGDAQTGRVLLESDSTVVTFDEPAEWIVVNAEGASFLRVFYPPEDLDTLASVAFEQLLPIERYALIDDAWAAVLADSMSAAAFLALLESLSAEVDRSVWARLLAGFGAVERLLIGDARLNFHTITHDALAPALAGLTLSPQQDDDDRSRQLRGDLIRAMGITADDEEIQREADRTVAEGRRDPELVEASIMSAAIDVAAAFGDSADLADFLSAYQNASTPQEQLRYLYATADFPDFEQVKVVLDMILNGDVRSQSAHLWMNRALRNRKTGAEVWLFVQMHWDEFLAVVPSTTFARMLGGLATHTHAGDAAATESFLNKHPVPSAGKAVTQLLERQRVGSALRVREAGRLNAILAP